MTHRCVSNPTIIVSEYGLLRGRGYRFRVWLVAWSGLSHYLNQCWITINWTIKNNFSEISKRKRFDWRKCIWKCRLQNGAHFVTASLTRITTCMGGLQHLRYRPHDDVIKWEHFRVTSHLCGEFTGPRRIPHKKASDAELWCSLLKRLSKR